MQNRRQLIEGYLKEAQSKLQERVKHLAEKKLDRKAQKRDVQYRQGEAAVRQFQRRLKALDKVDAVKADLEVRRVERAEKAKLPKEKKKKAAPAPVAKGKGGAKKEKKAAAT